MPSRRGNPRKKPTGKRRRSYSWKFQNTRLPSVPPIPSIPEIVKQGIIQRPTFSVELQFENNPSLKTRMLLDSGADFSMLSPEWAIELGIDLDKCITGDFKCSGIGGAVEIVWCEVKITLLQQDKPQFTLPVQIPNDPSKKIENLLGREPLFREFDASFRLAFAEPKGKFVLTNVTKRRDPSNYG